MKPFSIYVVDDEIFYADIIADFLEIKKYKRPKVFLTADMMLEQLNSKPDIVILDLVMPGMSGTEALKKIKAFDSDIYVVMLSSQQDLMTVVNLLKYGAFDYIIKDELAFKKLLTVLNKIEQVEMLKKKIHLNMLGKIRRSRKQFRMHKVE